MNLKPQDVAVVLKLCSYGKDKPSFSHMAVDLFMSPSEVHAAVKRAETARLLHGHHLHYRPNIPAIEEFLVHGLKYSFPPRQGELTRGIPTSYAAEPLRSLVTSSDEPVPVWPYSEGAQRGTLFEPLYPSAPAAALRDPFFYECLALADALRAGRKREQHLAERELVRRLRRQAHEQPKS